MHFGFIVSSINVELFTFIQNITQKLPPSIQNTQSENRDHIQNAPQDIGVHTANSIGQEYLGGKIWLE